MADGHKGLSLGAILVIGFIAAAMLLGIVLGVNAVISRHSPSRDNVERLIRQRKFDQALSLAQRIPEGNVEGHLLTAKAWLVKAWQRLNEESWASYGTDESDWFSSPEVDSALRHLDYVRESDPSNSPGRLLLALIYTEKGWFSEAESQLTSIIQEHHDNIAARLQWASVLAATDRPEEAERELRIAYGLAPSDPSVSKNLSFLYRYHLEIPESAMVWANRYLNLEPTSDPDRIFVKDQLLNLLERYPEYSLQESQKWRRKSRFRSRESIVPTEPSSSDR